jgi:EAL domain-containing protein (putative c-di-GMP-specific phosphodiesterase class I)
VRDAGIDISLVELEVTESMLITNPDSTRRVLQQLSTQGARIVLDDFGVGHTRRSDT